MNSKILTFTLAVFMLLFFSCNHNEQYPKKQTEKTVTASIQVIQFHSEHRCMTCNLIEKLTRETMQQNFPDIPFKLVNIDEAQNEKMAEEFEVTGTALFIYNSATQKKKDLSDFAFMNAKSKPDEFKKGLKKEIELFVTQ